nr:hypothetical protein CFP56_09372 [Quercus suber]
MPQLSSSPLMFQLLLQTSMAEGRDIQAGSWITDHDPENNRDFGDSSKYTVGSAGSTRIFWCPDDAGSTGDQCADQGLCCDNGGIYRSFLRWLKYTTRQYDDGPMLLADVDTISPKLLQVSQWCECDTPSGSCNPLRNSSHHAMSTCTKGKCLVSEFAHLPQRVGDTS